MYVAINLAHIYVRCRFYFFINSLFLCEKMNTIQTHLFMFIMIFNDFNIFLTSFRHIIDGQGASTVFNGHTPLVDKLYTKSNHYISGMYVT